MSKATTPYRNGPSCVYFLGFTGSAIYFITTASGFWTGVWGFIKAFVWPAFLVYEAFIKLGV